MLLAVLLFMQTATWPFAYGELGYLTDDPVRPDRLGLATRVGRYSAEFPQGCDWASAGNEVVLLPGDDGTLSVGVPDGGPSCQVAVLLMSMTPCFTNDAGDCDVADEQ